MSDGTYLLRVLLLAAALSALAFAVTGRIGHSPRSQASPAVPAMPVLSGRAVAPAHVIAAEADLFRVYRSAAAGAESERRRSAHPRTMATFQALRIYPGAPPRIPHGLTAAEFRTTSCRTCHERGGYSTRFQAYAPMTPHPELADCQQCHVADAAVVGVRLPDVDPDALCRQCHQPGNREPANAGLDWRPAPWIKPAPRSIDGTPPEIPHDLHLRGRCAVCHSGPAAVAELRTSHPQWTSCRDCHVASSDALEFQRTGGTP